MRTVIIVYRKHSEITLTKAVVVKWRTHISLKLTYCFYLGPILDICAKYQMPVPVRNAGIIHSHSSFPWQYPQEENCSLGLTTRDNHTLRFTVSKMDLFEADSLTVIGRAEEIPADDSNGPLVKRSSSESATQVKFVFDIKPFTLSGRGFVICYKCEFVHVFVLFATEWP